VVGVFDSRGEAEQARQDLIRAGFGENDVRIVAQQSQGTAARAEDRDEGFWESVKDFFGFADDEDSAYYQEAARRGGTLLQVTAESDTEVDRAVQILERYKAVDLESRSQQWRAEGWQGYQTAQRTKATASAGGAARGKKTGDKAIPVVEEQLQVGKRVVQRGGVRIHTHVTEKPVEAQVNLREEHVRVERRPVNRPATEADFNAATARQGSIEVTESAEVPVVSKQARVVEEVVVDKDVQERTEKVHDTVRRTDVDVEKTNPNAQQQRQGSASREQDRV
jgi:uncharacterized protein (TIGR02271 family)